MIEPPFEDLLWVIQRGLERGTHLLVAEELINAHYPQITQQQGYRPSTYQAISFPPHAFRWNAD